MLGLEACPMRRDCLGRVGQYFNASLISLLKHATITASRAFLQVMIYQSS